MGPLIPLFWTSDDVSSGFKARVGSALFKLSGGKHCYVTHSLRFTSGVTPADLLVASMVTEPSLPHTCKALVGFETRSYHATTHSVRSGRPDALLTELSWLSLKKKVFIFYSMWCSINVFEYWLHFIAADK